MSIYGSSLVFVGYREIYDPNSGLEYETTYRGTEADCAAFAAAQSGAGWRCELAKDESGGASVSVRQPGQNKAGTPETPTDKWEIQTDYYQSSLWGNRRLRERVATSLGGSPTETQISEQLAYIRKRCELALKGVLFTEAPGGIGPDQETELSKGPLTPSESAMTDTLMLSIYTQMVLGTENYEAERVSVSRVRTFSVNYGGRMQLRDVPVIWSPAAFVSTFSVPASISAKLPTPPATKPDETEWAYKQRKHVSTIDFYGKVTEVIEWTFAAWSTILYDLDPT